MRNSDSTARSCTSSIITWVQGRSCPRGIPTISWINIPFVMNVILVCSLYLLSPRIWYPISSPSETPSSSATRFATPMQAIRRGWVTIILQCWPFSWAASRIYFGTYVVFPHPVSPWITTTFHAAIFCMIRVFSWKIGRSSGLSALDPMRDGRNRFRGAGVFRP